MTFKRIKIKKIPLFLVEHALEAILVLFLLALLIGLALFYTYNFYAKKDNLGNLGQLCPLEDVVYTNVLEVWKKHDQMSDQVMSKNYRNLFLTDVEEKID